MPSLQRIKPTHFLILLFIVFSNVFSQRHTIRTYTIEDGLPTNVINDLTQDHYGRIWVATEIGISVYDGTAWKNFAESDGLATNNYSRLRTDEEGTVWALPQFATSHIQFFKNDKWYKIKKSGYTRNDMLFNTFDVKIENGNPIVLAGTDKSVHLYKNEKWIDLGSFHKQLVGNVNSIKLVDGKFYITNDNGIFITDGTTFDETINSIVRPPSKRIIATEFDNSYGINRLWLLGRDWIGYYDLDIRKFELVITGIYLRQFPTFARNFIVPDKINRVFFGNIRENFILELSSKKIFRLGMANGFTNDGCSNIYVDKEKNIWFPTPRGIDKMTNVLFTNYSKKDGLGENEVACVEEIKPGEYFFGHNFGFTIFKNDKFYHFDHSNRVPVDYSSGRVMDACRDKDGNIYFAATFAGLGKYSKDGTITWLSDSKNGEIGFSAVQLDSKGQLWTGSLNGLYKYSNGKLGKFSQLDGRFEMIRQIYFSENGKQFITSSSGLFVVEKNRLIPAVSKEYRGSYFSIHDYDDNSYLVGKNSGVYLLKDRKVTKFNFGSYSIDRKVFFINKDRRGIFWFGTDDGVFWWDGKNLRKFSMENGLSGRETNRFAWLNDSRGKVWIGTDRGVSLYQAEYDFPESIPVIQHVLLTDMSGQTFSLRTDLELPYSNNTFSISSNAISFRDEKSINYRVKLSGFDDTWLELGKSNTSRYTNLPYGDYRLYVQAKNANGVWSNSYVSGVITISRPLYMTWWFAIIVAAALISGLAFVYSYSSQKKYSTELEKEVNVRTEALFATEQKMKTLIENSPTLITTFDSTGKIIFMNKELSRIKKENLIGHNLLEFFPKEIYQELSKVISDVFNEKKIIYYPYLFKQFAPPLYLENYVSPIISTDGSVKEAVVISIDQTEKMKSVNEKRLIEEKQNTILHALPIALYNGDNKYGNPPTWFSDSITNLTGFTPEEFYTNKVVWRNRLHPDDAVIVSQVLNNLAVHKTVTLEYRWLTADGKYKWFLDFISPTRIVQDGTIEYFGIWFDITERKRAQYRLEMLNEYFLKFGTNPNENINKIVQLCGQELNADIALYNCLIDDKLISVGMWGIPEDYNPIDSPEGHICLDVINSASKEPILLNDLPKTKYAQTDSLVMKYGVKTYLGFPVPSGGKTKGSLCVVFNEFEEPTPDDLKFISILGAAIAVEEERRSAMQLLKESVKEKETLLREVYHRVKNNLQVISSLLYLQATNIKDRALLDMFQESQNRVRSMALVHESLYKSKTLTDIDFNEYINNLINHLKDSFQIDNEINVVLESEKIALNIDRAIPCGLILNELITNSFKYGRPVNANAQQEIYITVKTDDTNILLVVKDNGKGMPDSNMLEGKTKTLGVNLIKKLTRQLDGTVKYEYESGAKFIINFPA